MIFGVPKQTVAKRQLIVSPISSPLLLRRGWSHGKHDAVLGSIFCTYAGRTPGTEAAHNATVMLSKKDEVQPDVVLRISPAFGGQSRTTEDDYAAGAPELVAEIAHSSRAIDLHLKKERYALAGVLEYIVVCLRPLRLHWFDLPNKQEFTASSDGILRSLVFPGLWIDREALLQMEYERCIGSLNLGMQTQEHKDFVAKLRAAHVG